MPNTKLTAQQLQFHAAGAFWDWFSFYVDSMVTQGQTTQGFTKIEIRKIVLAEIQKQVT